ncbi:TonB-dependent receptor plug domain-containing protein [Siphonobacter sp. SORGH_AS_0500]|uniref:TonB-dependent receptor n=1 Tax=Siphonobacter sp. SORGH_AS_0500 TaxID=1864824 RepID=UPI0028598829|nr:TonB-dependent receptor plug domain-containing protein [Siphonobacter sp. SORGH_AS_0500]MDR6197740.1 outer membrane receptor protein involved in Fe transport [Siphonobacter sp. SORGH_AS_0500]
MRYIYLVSFLFISGYTYAQTSAATQVATIRGKIHFEGGDGVEHVTVRLKNSKVATMSDERGSFELTNVPYGPHELLISSVEIQPKTVRLHVNKSAHQLPILVNKAIKDLSEVQVTHKTEKKELETQGFAMNVIETKEVATRNFQTNEMLDRTVGVRVRQNGGLGSSVTYNLNGMSGESVRIFIDGIPISTYGASFSLNSIPPALIERIEVYKGVIPAHLSDDALGGAINVILKKGMSNNLTASLSYGSFNTLQANVSGTHRSAKSGFTVKASGFYNYSDNDYEVWGKFVRNILPNGRYDYVRARRFNDAYRSGGGQIELGFTDVKWADQFFIGYNGSSDYKEVQHGTYMSIPYKGRFTESEAHVFSLNYRKKNFMVKGLELTLSGMSSMRKQVVVDTVKWNYNWYGERSVGLDGRPILRPTGAQQGAPTINHINRNVTTFRAGITYDIHRNHRFVVNHMYYNIDRNQQDFMRSAVEREFIGTRNLAKNITSVAYELKALDSKLRANIFGKYYQQKIDRMDPVLVENNRQENRTSSNKTTTGYGAALSYAIIPNLYLLTSAERAVRLPSENEVFGSPGENIVENFGIRPEISNNLNVGFRAGTYTAGLHKYNFALSGFIRDTRDKIVQRVNPRLNDAVQTDPFENLGKTKSIGFELEGNYIYNNNLIIGLNASKFNSVFNMRYDANGREFDYYGRQLPNEPFFTINSTVQYAFKNLLATNSRLNVYYGFRFVERFYTTWMIIEDFRTTRQYIQDLGASYVFPNKKFIVSADVKNMFDRQAYDNFAVQKPGRAFYLKLNYTINNF